MVAPAILISEGLLAVLEVWREVQRQKGVSEAQIDQAFEDTYPSFMKASEKPVDPVKEN
jgi:hypothetical protein